MLIGKRLKKMEKGLMWLRCGKQFVTHGKARQNDVRNDRSTSPGLMHGLSFIRNKNEQGCEG